MGKVNSSDLKQAIKLVMKQQGKSYEDLAQQLNISLVSVKRIMSKEELNMSRFVEICNWLEINLADLEKIARYEQAHQKIRFTEKQEDFLAKNPEYLSFLFNLYTDETPEKIQKKFGLTKKSLDLYLLRLEKYDLVKKKNQVYKPTYPEFPSPIPYGQLVKAQFSKVLEAGTYFFKRYNETLVERKDPEQDKGSQTILGVLEVSQKSYLAWFEKYQALYLELVQTSKVEENIKQVKNKKSVVLMHMHAMVPPNDISIDSIKNMFGRVAELKS